MKSLIVILLLFTPFIAFSQNSKKNSVQKAYYQKALNNLSNSNITKAHFNFSAAYLYNKESDIGKQALKKHDSLQPIVDSINLDLKNKMLKNIQGKWKMKKIGSNWGFQEVSTNSETSPILIINKYEISFFEGLDFMKSAHIYSNSESRFVDSDNQVWTYSLKNTDLLHFIHSGEITENGFRSAGVCGNKEFYYERIK